MTAITFILLSLGLVGYLLKYFLDKEKSTYTLLMYSSIGLLVAGIINLSLSDLTGSVIALITIASILIMARGLESDKDFMKKIYKEAASVKAANPELDDAGLMEKIIGSNFPEIEIDSRREIIENSEDLEEMLFKAVEFETTGKISKSTESGFSG